MQDNKWFTGCDQHIFSGIISEWIRGFLRKKQWPPVPSAHPYRIRSVSDKKLRPFQDHQHILKYTRSNSHEILTFDSCNNYSMPDPIEISCQKVEYWYAETEEKDRKWDIEYVKKHIPQTVFRKFGNIGHGGLAALQPERFASGIENMISGE